MGEKPAGGRSHRGLPHITQYLLNYAAADPAYTEESRNCQTFAADFFRFLTGNSAVGHAAADSRPACPTPLGGGAAFVT